MAENFSDEGLDRLLGIMPRNTVAIDVTLYLAALTTAGYVTRNPDTALTATGVPSRTTVWATHYQTTAGGSTNGAGGEPNIGTGAYARKSVAAADWGVPATNGSGRRSTAALQNFPASTAAWSNQNVIGFALVTSASAGSGVAYYYANFDDASTVAMNAAGITLQVTPFWQRDI
jgi:hypothetical protein